MATSGLSERGAHIADPSTGRPVADRGSLTVVAPTGFLADCLATGLFVAGPDAALTFAAEHPGIEVMVIERRGPQFLARASAGLHGRIEQLSDRVARRVPRAHSQPTPRLGEEKAKKRSRATQG